MQLKDSLSLIAICLAASCSLAPVRAVTLQSRQAPGSLGLGEKCSQSVQCQTGNCRRAHCAEKVGNGNTCYKDANCISNDCYDASICYTPGGGVIGNGARCSTSASCASGNCSRSRCADKVYLGGPCYKVRIAVDLCDSIAHSPSFCRTTIALQDRAAMASAYNPRPARHRAPQAHQPRRRQQVRQLRSRPLRPRPLQRQPLRLQRPLRRPPAPQPPSSARLVKEI